MEIIGWVDLNNPQCVLSWWTGIWSSFACRNRTDMLRPNLYTLSLNSKFFFLRSNPVHRKLDTHILTHRLLLSSSPFKPHVKLCCISVCICFKTPNTPSFPVYIGKLRQSVCVCISIYLHMYSFYIYLFHEHYIMTEAQN